MHILRVVVDEPSKSFSYSPPVVAHAESSEGKFTVTAAELVASLSRDMERIEQGLRKLMLLR